MRYSSCSAASDLSFALTEIAATFRVETGREVRVTFGSSGNFVRQIRQGAPFEMFLSADEGYVYRLAEEGLTIDRGTPYAMGRIVLFAPYLAERRQAGELNWLGGPWP